MSKLFNKRNIFLLIMLISMLCACAGLRSRFAAENTNNTVGVLIDYRNIVTLAAQSGKSTEEVWHELKEAGMAGITANESTGDSIVSTMPMSTTFGTAAQFCDDAENPERAAVRFPTGTKYTEKLKSYLKLKIPALKFVEKNGFCTVILPGTTDEFKFAFFIPDLEALDFAQKNNIPVSFRPGPCCNSDGKHTAESFEYLCDQYPVIKNVTPAGLIAPGNPDAAPFAEAMKKRGVTLSMVEFVKQIGVPALAGKMDGQVLPMHSLTKDEIISRAMDKKTIQDRYVRAVHERSIRLIYVHPYDLEMGNRFEAFKNDMMSYKKILESKDYVLTWPEAMGEWKSNIFGAVACVLALLASLWMYICRLRGTDKDSVKISEIAVLLVCACVLTVVFMKLGIVSKILGGFCGALAATEAAIFMLDDSQKSALSGALGGIFVIVAGGLSIASFYGTSQAALRLTPFSGVKLTLLLPLILVFAHDIKRRVHPEGLEEIASRPSLWGELAVVGVAFIAVAVMALRSDNVSNVPAFEIAFRNFVEKVMVVRPRTKEFLIGYPALVIYWYLKRRDLLPKYREAIRLAAVLAFASAINTFCHFHTRLMLTVVRVLNGWWLGLVIGTIAMVVIHFLRIKVFSKNEEQKI